MAQTKVVIRTATRRDVPAIVALWEELMDFHQARDRLFTRARTGSRRFAGFVQENLRNDAACVLVAAAADRIVGYCQGMLDQHPPALAEPQYGQILDFMVTAEYRRAGIGEQMFKTLCDWFRREGMHRIEVRHATTNEMAGRFWRKMGFQPYLLTLFTELR
jgi:ribosomal protein S18 acetylase RimI-like enzyme